MKALYRFACALAVAGILLVPAWVRAAEMRTDCAQLSQNAERFQRLTQEIAATGNRIETTGWEMAAHVQGAGATAFQSSLQRTSDSIRAAFPELHAALESLHASCPQDNAPQQHLKDRMHMGMVRSAQSWDFPAISTGSAHLHASEAQLRALTDELRSVPGDFGIHRERGVARLGDAISALNQANHTLEAYAQTMKRQEDCIAGKFSGSAHCKQR